MMFFLTSLTIGSTFPTFTIGSKVGASISTSLFSGLLSIRLGHCLQGNHRTRYGTSSDIDEEAPSPVALFAHGYQCDRRVGTSDVPVDGGMIPFAQSLLPLAPGGEGMVSGGSDIRHEYAGKIEDDARCPPFIVVTKKCRA